ncbi:FecR family protein [Sphingomonas colocasiae]|uniref:FecR domain-containing protein n=1 Tax=Sphingomonas colocasiae TaxID=1848973 RepID=A0ABS7PUN5_9SPHN|nr:FecR domain-containing protein [Sphingomonas colocasiae]MBY8824913.1 FecR domain-containing protein [Sphingomonas colocasiae]
MTRVFTSETSNETPHVIAAKWALRHEDGPLRAEEQHAFEQWIAADATHALAWEDVNWALDAPARHAASPELLDIRSAALTARAVEPRRSPRYLAVLASVAAATIIALLASPLVPDNPTPGGQMGASPEQNGAVYRTAIGERSSITLPDGSVVTLDTDSELHVDFNGHRRGLNLVRGQALFEVAKATRPFVVNARGRMITALGTRFNVRIDGPKVRVALLHGLVRVDAAMQPTGKGKSARMPETVMRAGEIMEASDTRQSVAVAPNVEQAASWKTGQLVFNDTPLASAVAEINRYTVQPIAIADVAVENYRISGVFRSADPRQFAVSMTEILPVRVHFREDGTAVLRARTP